MDEVVRTYNKILGFCQLYNPLKYSRSLLLKKGDGWTHQLEGLIWELFSLCDSVTSDSTETGKVHELREVAASRFQDYLNLM